MNEDLTVEQFLLTCESDLILKSGSAPAIPFSSVGVNQIGSDRRVTLLISTNAPDRKNHIVNPRGGNLDNYRANPVFMWNHLGYTDPSKIIGKGIQIVQSDDHILATVEYVPLRSNPLPEQLWELETKGLLPGNSIGLRPMGKITRSETGVITIGEWELLDISKVTIGMNQTATNKLIQV